MERPKKSQAKLQRATLKAKDCNVHAHMSNERERERESIGTFLRHLTAASIVIQYSLPFWLLFSGGGGSGQFMRSRPSDHDFPLYFLPIKSQFSPVLSYFELTKDFLFQDFYAAACLLGEQKMISG